MTARYEAQKMVSLFEVRVTSAKQALDRALESGRYERVMRCEDRLDEAQEGLAAWKNVLASL